MRVRIVKALLRVPWFPFIAIPSSWREAWAEDWVAEYMRHRDRP